MIVGTLEVEVFIPEANSLKDKRRVLKSLKDRLRVRFNVSVAETAPTETWRRATIGIATVGSDSRQVNSILSNVMNFLVGFRQIQLVHHELEIN